LQATFGSCTVVSLDENDEPIVELTRFLHCVEQASDLIVSITVRPILPLKGGSGLGKTTSSPKAAATSINMNVKTQSSLAAFKIECLNIDRLLSFFSNSVVNVWRDTYLCSVIHRKGTMQLDFGPISKKIKNGGGGWKLDEAI
jgi:hypothetical protein